MHVYLEHMCIHTHTHMLAHTHKPKYAHRHTCTHTHKHSLTHSLSLCPSLSLSFCVSVSVCLSLIHSHSLTVCRQIPDWGLCSVFQIRLFTRSCNGKAACNCAVAVKSGDDVILFDRCGAQQGKADGRPIQFQMLVNGELTTGTRVIRRDDGKAYEVCACKSVLCHL